MNFSIELFKTHPSWPAVVKVVGVLKKKGHQAFLAGGSVRDGFLGRTPKDFDIATDAEPGEVETYFPKTIDVGRSFGVMIVNWDGFNVEVTTFRKDGPYKDGRHPESVEFSSAQEDAVRRDFTINALFYDIHKEEVLDFTGGIKDLEAKTIRAVGNPFHRFQEDKLRALRAIRFAAELNFEIDEATWTALLMFRKELGQVSRERITDELRKLILSKNPMKGLILLKESEFLQEIWPGLSLLQSDLYSRYLMRSFHFLTHDIRLEMYLSILLLLETHFEMEHVGINYQVGMDRQLKGLMDFRFPREVVRTISFCLKNFPQVTAMNTKSLTLLGEEFGIQLLDLLNVYLYAKGESAEGLEKFRLRYLSLCEASGELPRRWVSGDDLEKLKIPKGPIYASILEKAYIKQLDKEFESKDQALKWVQKTYLDF